MPCQIGSMSAGDICPAVLKEFNHICHDFCV